MELIKRLEAYMDEAQKKDEEEKKAMETHVLVGYTAPLPEFLAQNMSVMLSTVNEEATLDFRKYTSLFLEHADKFLNEAEKSVFASWSVDGLKYMLMPAITAAEKLKVDPDVFYGHLFMLIKDEIRKRINAV